ncbi:MAG: cytochrome c maturation protein CcmE [Alphaproteobacteria bacterium]|nr:cytochrome c maturation protein CcmE [Alphaproteobacteria bacterium]
MNEAVKRRIFALVALAVAAGALGTIAFSDMGEDLVYYWSPTELLARDDAMNHTVRLGGQVEPGTIDWDKEAQTVSFSISDGSASVPVSCKGNPPQMFREGIGVVVEGELQPDGVFHTEKIMVKHSNEYKAPEGTETDPRKLYSTLDQG